jgi:acetyl-CoA C-acetyltransferase
MGDGQLYDIVLRDGLNDAFSDKASGWHTEDLVKTYQRSQGMGREQIQQLQAAPRATPEALKPARRLLTFCASLPPPI